MLDGILAVLDGPGDEVWIFDFRRPSSLGTVSQQSTSPTVSAAQGAGLDTLALTGLQPTTVAICAGDYFGVNGYLYMATFDASTDSGGNTVVQFRPRLRAAVAAAAVADFNAPTARFR